MWHFWGGHYHIRLSKVPIFDKIIVENELTRAGSLEKNISKKNFGDFLDFRPRKWNKKKYRIDGLAAKNFHMPKMWYFSLFRPIFPPCGGVEGGKWAKFTFSIFLVPTWWDLAIKRKIQFRSQKSCLFDTHGPPRYAQGYMCCSLVSRCLLCPVASVTYYITPPGGLLVIRRASELAWSRISTRTYASLASFVP